MIKMHDSLENEMLRLSDMRENPELTPESVLTFRNGFRLCHNIMIKKQEQLEAENANLKKIIANEISENDDYGSEFVIASILREENAKLKDALKWYADADHWEKTRTIHFDSIECTDLEIKEINGNTLLIGGKRARQCLKECEDMNG